MPRLTFGGRKLFVGAIEALVARLGTRHFWILGRTAKLVAFVCHGVVHASLAVIALGSGQVRVVVGSDDLIEVLHALELLVLRVDRVGATAPGACQIPLRLI